MNKIHIEIITTCTKLAQWLQKHTGRETGEKKTGAIHHSEINMLIPLALLCRVDIYTFGQFALNS